MSPSLATRAGAAAPNPMALSCRRWSRRPASSPTSRSFDALPVKLADCCGTRVAESCSRRREQPMPRAGIRSGRYLPFLRWSVSSWTWPYDGSGQLRSGLYLGALSFCTDRDDISSPDTERLQTEAIAIERELA